jgi:hypothetical protein
MLWRLLAGSLVVLLFLPALADATPPDPSWLGGFWDDDDYDEVVILISAIPSPPPAAFVQCPDPQWITVFVIGAAEESPSAAPPPRPLSRGPPRS